MSHDYAYVYDNVGRLTQVTRDGQVVESYAYTGPGTGRTSETNTLRGLTTRAYAYDTEDHLPSAGPVGASGPPLPSFGPGWTLPAWPASVPLCSGSPSSLPARSSPASWPP